MNIVHYNSHNLEQKINDCIAKLAEKRTVQRYTWDFVEVRMSSRFRIRAGQVKFWRLKNRMLVEFSEVLFAGMTEQEKYDVVAHELAHVVCFRNPEMGDNHDAGWKAVCRDMGGDGERLSEATTKLKRNIVRRVVLTDVDKHYAITITTARRASRIMAARPRCVRLGSIALDWNNKTYRWDKVVNMDCRTLAVLKGDWKLVS